MVVLMDKVTPSILTTLHLPTNARDTDLIPGLGGSHMPQSNQAHVPQQLSLCSKAGEPQLLKPMHHRAHALKQEKAPQ